MQASNRALASLKYFYEDMPEAYVVAAGSPLGVAANREGYSMPVSKVDTLTLHPMAFDEFLAAIDQGSLVGGMPEAVCIYAETGDFKEVADVQNNILDLYVADMAKYAQPYETARIMEAWHSVAAQLSKENKKFQFDTPHA